MENKIKCIPGQQLSKECMERTHRESPCHLSSDTARECDSPNADTADVEHGEPAGNQTPKRTSKSTTAALPLRRKEHSTSAKHQGIQRMNSYWQWTRSKTMFKEKAARIWCWKNFRKDAKHTDVAEPLREYQNERQTSDAVKWTCSGFRKTRPQCDT